MQPNRIRCGVILPAALLAAALWTPEAGAVSIELKDVAPDRVERQRSYTRQPAPLPGTPDTSRLAERLAERGLKSGSPILIRIFKAESELELWMEKDGVFVSFATYPVCNWSGTLGPKLREGDKQTPEGFYTITSRQLHRLGRWRHALNLGFPNAFDEAHQRDGSYILVHGGCSSSGCFAMTDPVVLEIFKLTSAALRGGQYHVPVHVFPFRMSDENIARHQASEWTAFWADLKEGYASFERTRRPPRISVCEGRYRVQDASPLEAGSTLPLAVCGATAAAILASNASAWLVPLPNGQPPQAGTPEAAAQLQYKELARRQELPPQPSGSPAAAQASLPPPQASRRSATPDLAPASTAAESERIRSVASIRPDLEYELVPRLTVVRSGASAKRATASSPVPCNLALASCRKFVALRDRREAGLRERSRKQRTKTASKAR